MRHYCTVSNFTQAQTIYRTGAFSSSFEAGTYHGVRDESSPPVSTVTYTVVYDRQLNLVQNLIERCAWCGENTDK